MRRTPRSLQAAIIFLGLAPCLPALALDQALVDAARKEGRVVWYTTQIVNQFARPAAEAFEKKYGIHVDYVRADSNEVALRILNEGRAGKVSSTARPPLPASRRKTSFSTGCRKAPPGCRNPPQTRPATGWPRISMC